MASRFIGMGQYIAPEGMSLFDCGLDLGHRELQAVERIEGRGDAARHHDLDRVTTQAHLFAHCAAHLIDAIDLFAQMDHGIAAEAGILITGACAIVVVTAGGAERATGDEHPRARQQALIDGRFESPVGTASITHRGEAAIEHLAHPHRGPRRVQGEREFPRAGGYTLPSACCAHGSR